MEARGRIEVTPRILSLLPAATDMLTAMGAADRLVGISHLCRAPGDLPRVLSSPIDSDAWDMGRIHLEVRRRLERGEPLYVPDRKRIAELRPHVVITQGLCPVCAAGPETVHDAACGARLVTLAPHTLEDVARDISTVGEAAGCPDAAAALAREFRERLERARGAPSNGVRVAVVEWFDPLWISGEWILEMVEAAGGEPVPLKRGADSRACEVSELAGADVIILAPCSMSIDRAQREIGALEKIPEWHDLPAVRAGRVVLMDGEAHFSAPGPGLAEGVERLAAELQSV